MPAIPPLSPRLAAVAARVLPGLPMADIGTDHAYLPTHLVAAGVVPRAIATDLRPGPLAAARQTVAAAGLLDRIELRLGDGLRVLAPGEAATLVIAGMGGPQATAILAAAPAVVESARRLVLQPQGGEEGVRRWLVASGWHLAVEELVADAGRLYVVLAADPGPGAPLDEADLALGPHLRRQGGPLFRAYVAGHLARAQAALAGARRARRPDPARLDALSARVRLLEAELARLG